MVAGSAEKCNVYRVVGLLHIFHKVGVVRNRAVTFTAVTWAVTHWKLQSYCSSYCSCQTRDLKAKSTSLSLSLTLSQKATRAHACGFCMTGLDQIMHDHSNCMTRKNAFAEIQFMISDFLELRPKLLLYLLTTRSQNHMRNFLKATGQVTAKIQYFWPSLVVL